MNFRSNAEFEAFERHAKAFIGAREPELLDIYNNEGIGLTEACWLVADRERAGIHGLDKPRWFFRSQPGTQIPKMTTTDPAYWQAWLDDHDDPDRHRADSEAGKRKWEAFHEELRDRIRAPLTRTEETATIARR